MQSLKEKIYIIIFKTDSKPGKIFDILLLLLILLSIGVVLVESIVSIRNSHPLFFLRTEWIFTALFSLEYLLRIYSHPKPLKYITSFMGIIDLLAIVPTYFGLFFESSNFLLTVRAFRLMRLFRVLKLTRYISAADLLSVALRQSLRKIIVFFEAVLLLVLFLGTIMYLVEGENSGFTSIPQSIYWAIVTITTVGYGDIAPVTVVGKTIASIAMLTGYSIIAVPTGIISVEIGKASSQMKKQKYCKNCEYSTDEKDAEFCSRCGTKLVNKPSDL